MGTYASDNSSQLVSYEEEISIHCVAHCRNCSVDTSVENQKSKCEVCSSPLVYFCVMCDEPFLNPATVLNHVIKQIEQASILIKCAKCYRSDFSTRCILTKHERNCNTLIHFNRDVTVNLERFKLKAEIVEDVMPLLPVETYQNQCADYIKTDYDFSYVHDDLEIGEEFKSLFTTHPTSVCQNTNQAEKTVISVSTSEVNGDSNLLANHHGVRQRRVAKQNKPRDPNANKCRKCEKSFKYKSHLRKHSETCGRSKNLTRSLKYSCDQCNFKTIHKYYLATHVQIKHLPRDPNANKCDKCKQIFSYQSGLQNHLRFCGKSKSELDSLMRFYCDHCDYKTVRKSDISTHIQIKHLPRDPNANKCNKCKKSFFDSSSLSKHSRICGKSKNELDSLMRFYCDHCDYKTVRKDDLSCHIQAKHLGIDSRANKCKKCKRSFSHRSGLWKHSKICGQ